MEDARSFDSGTPVAVRMNNPSSLEHLGRSWHGANAPWVAPIGGFTYTIP
jgi:hypothetical protein